MTNQFSIHKIRRYSKFQILYNEYYQTTYKKLLKSNHKYTNYYLIKKIIPKIAFNLTIQHIKNNGIQTKIFQFCPNFNINDYKQIDLKIIENNENITLEHKLFEIFKKEENIILKNTKLIQFI